MMMMKGSPTATRMLRHPRREQEQPGKRRVGHHQTDVQRRSTKQRTQQQEQTQQPAGGRWQRWLKLLGPAPSAPAFLGQPCTHSACPGAAGSCQRCRRSGRSGTPAGRGIRFECRTRQIRHQFWAQAWPLCRWLYSQKDVRRSRHRAALLHP